MKINDATLRSEETLFQGMEKSYASPSPGLEFIPAVFQEWLWKDGSIILCLSSALHECTDFIEHLDKKP